MKSPGSLKVVSGLSPDTIRASVTRIPPEAEEKLLTQPTIEITCLYEAAA
jgi:hypothetical protein